VVLSELLPQAANVKAKPETPVARAAFEVFFAQALSNFLTSSALLLAFDVCRKRACRNHVHCLLLHTKLVAGFSALYLKLPYNTVKPHSVQFKTGFK
jgi:hypothetical protein